MLKAVQKLVSGMAVTVLLLLGGPSSCAAVVAAPVQSLPESASAKQRAGSVFEHGLLWRVEKSGLAPSYVFGTIHSEDQRVLSSLSHVTQALDSAQRLALEMDLNAAATGFVLQAMVFSDGRTLPSVVGKALFERTAAAARDHGLTAQQIVVFKPWAITTLLSMPKATTGVFMDKVLYDEAREQGKRVFGLETPEEQVAVLDGIAMKDQVRLLEDTLAHYHRMPEMFEKLINAYLTRDLGSMEALYDKYMSDSSERLTELLRERLLVERNQRMVTRMMPLLEQGNTFVAIGSLHLPGEQGILRLLVGQGFRVERVY